MPRDRAGSPRTPSRLEDDAQGAGATDALLEVREKGGGGHGGCETQAAWDPYRTATSRAGRKLAVVNSLRRAILRLVAVETERHMAYKLGGMIGIGALLLAGPSLGHGKAND